MIQARGEFEQARAPDRLERLAGCLLGGAVGDALGLPLEGLSNSRAKRMFRPPLRHRFLLGRGMVSDDTEHACLTAIALCRSGGDPGRFARHLSAGLRKWLCTLPAGAGLATLKATIKLCLGASPSRSGVYSAGNGPAMRSSIVGAYFAEEPDRIEAWIDICSRITHTDPRASEGACLIAMEAAGRTPQLNRETWKLDLIDRMLDSGASPSQFAAEMGLERGVSGFVLHTVPVAIYCARWSRGDFRQAIEAAAALGGDADTVCAIVGGIVGAQRGTSAIPAEWIDGLWEWPRSRNWMRTLAKAMAEGREAPSTFWPAYIFRSPLFTATVLAHGFRRLLPPY